MGSSRPRVQDGGGQKAATASLGESFRPVVVQACQMLKRCRQRLRDSFLLGIDEALATPFGRAVRSTSRLEDILNGFQEVLPQLRGLFFSPTGFSEELKAEPGQTTPWLSALLENYLEHTIGDTSLEPTILVAPGEPVCDLLAAVEIGQATDSPLPPEGRETGCGTPVDWAIGLASFLGGAVLGTPKSGRGWLARIAIPVGRRGTGYENSYYSGTYVAHSCGLVHWLWLGLRTPPRSPTEGLRQRQHTPRRPSVGTLARSGDRATTVSSGDRGRPESPCNQSVPPADSGHHAKRCMLLLANPLGSLSRSGSVTSRG